MRLHPIIVVFHRGRVQIFRTADDDPCQMSRWIEKHPNQDPRFYNFAGVQQGGVQGRGSAAGKEVWLPVRGDQRQGQRCSKSGFRGAGAENPGDTGPSFQHRGRGVEAGQGGRRTVLVLLWLSPGESRGFVGDVALIDSYCDNAAETVF